MANENGPPTLMVFLMQKINLRKENIMADLQMQTVYISGETAGQRFDCQPIEIPFKLTESVWPYVVEAPDGSFKNPTYDWHDRKWIDQDATSQGQQITTLNEKVGQVSKAVQDLQTANENAAKTSKLNDTKLDNLTKLVAMTNASVGQIGQVVTKLAQVANEGAVKPSQSESASQSEQATQPSQPTQPKGDAN